MEVFLGKIFPAVFIIAMMTSSVETERLLTEKKNGNNGRTFGTKKSTKEYCNQDVIGSGRAINVQHEDPHLPCYTQFFVAGQPPTGLRDPVDDLDIRYICQPTIPNQDIAHTYYSTMFDEGLGIAVFSAYMVTPQTANFPGHQDDSGWCQTPGIKYQGNKDIYYHSGYHKGHLAPANTFSNNRQRFVSTYTYTNAVPQHSTFNSGQWRTFENRVRDYALACTQALPAGTLYLLTGTSFSRFDPNNFPQANQGMGQHHRLQHGHAAIRIPDSLWTAGCCERGPNTWSIAVIGKNLPNIGGNDQSLTRQVTVADLQIFLRRDAFNNNFNNNLNNNQNVVLFPGNNNICQNPPSNPPHLPIGK